MAATAYLTTKEFDEYMTELGLPYGFKYPGSLYSGITSTGGSYVIVARVENDGIISYRAGYYNFDPSEYAAKLKNKRKVKFLSVAVIPTSEIKVF